MPINREQFEHGLDNREMAILEFLRKHPREAFTPPEIQSALGGPGLQGSDINVGTLLVDLLGLMSLRSDLDHLISEGKVTRKTIESKDYFAAKLLF